MSNVIDNKEMLAQCQANFAGSPAEKYLADRGISKETAEKFCIGSGYIKGTFGTKIDAVVFPTSDYSYVSRKLDDNLGYDNRYINVGETSHFFNEAALASTDKPVFIVEGAIDALSIIECGGQAVALNSTNNAQRMLTVLKEAHPTQTIIIAMDTDAAGKKASAELADGLTKLKIPHYVVEVWDGCKDANELLQKNRVAFEKIISKAEAEAKQVTVKLSEADQKLFDSFMGNRMDNCMPQLLKSIEEDSKRPRISTGFPELDDAMGGGITPGLHVVAAMSSLGKTTLVLQAAGNMAKQGQDILLFSLEMSKRDLLAKDISRNTFESQALESRMFAQSTSDILNRTAYEPGKEKFRGVYIKAVESYEKYADKLFIIEGLDGRTIEQIEQTTKDFIRAVGRKPVVVIDYIQLIQPSNPKNTDKQNMDHALKGLKRMVALGVPVFAISSLNRSSYDSPVTLGSLKETGNLEYCAETVLAIDFKKMYDDPKNFKLNEEKQKSIRSVVLTILKNRNGPVGTQITMQFYPKYNYFCVMQDSCSLSEAKPAPKATKSSASTKGKHKAPF